MFIKITMYLFLKFKSTQTLGNVYLFSVIIKLFFKRHIDPNVIDSIESVLILLMNLSYKFMQLSCNYLYYFLHTLMSGASKT